MNGFFDNQAYSNLQTPDAVQNARLALHIAIYLRDMQCPSGRWDGNHLAHSLRYTCHTLESLHLLKFQAFQRILERGCNWLHNLSDEIAQDSDEWTTVRLHPSRFKTLAKLDTFSDRQLQEEFTELCERVDKQGFLQGVIEDQLLGAIILTDCLLESSVQKLRVDFPQDVLARTLPAVKEAFLEWCSNPHRLIKSRLINSVSNASYAYDVLMRSQQVTFSRESETAIKASLLEKLSSVNRSGSLQKEILYSAIQAETYFGQTPEFAQALTTIFTTLRSRFDNGQIAYDDRNNEILPLILRTLLVYGQQDLRERLISQMVDAVSISINQRRLLDEIEHKRSFEALIRRRTVVDIENVEELSGGITDARVFRVNYALYPSNIVEDNNENRPKLGVHSIVVKTGSRAELLKSIRSYNDLRSDIKHYFAQHAQQPELLESSPVAPAYLILEDLNHQFRTLRETFLPLDHRRLSDDDREGITRCSQVISRTLFDIYRKTRRRSSDLVGLQVSRLYFSRMDRSLIDICKPDKFPRLKDFFSGFWLGGKRYESIESYQARLFQYRDVFRPPMLCLVHGDCHGRNIMLNTSQERVKLIDLDKLDPAGDYITDAALLIEDVALFRRLFDRGYRHYLKADQIDLAASRVAVSFSPFISELGRHFQTAFLSDLARFAKSIDDVHFRQRLWLAIALNLLRLVEKHLNVENAVAIYAEAVKLLDALVANLENGEALPDYPITGTHPEPRTDRTVMLVSNNSEVQQFHESILAFQSQHNVTIDYDVRNGGKSIRYFFEHKDQPFAILDCKRHPPAILLACPSEELQRVGKGTDYIQRIDGTGIFSLALRPPKVYSVDVVKSLLTKAFERLISQK